MTLELNRNIQKANRLIREIRAQIGKLKEWIADLFKARETAPEQPPQSPNLANLLIKIFNTINFSKSMHYNPFAYIHSEKDILKLVNTLICNTKGDGKSGDDFWVKAETLLYCALIGYIHYEAPEEEQNFATLIELVNAMEVREDDETFENPVDIAFKELEKDKPNHFAVRQYKKYKLAAGDICSK